MYRPLALLHSEHLRLRQLWQHNLMFWCFCYFLFTPFGTDVDSCCENLRKTSVQLWRCQWNSGTKYWRAEKKFCDKHSALSLGWKNFPLSNTCDNLWSRSRYRPQSLNKKYCLNHKKSPILWVMNSILSSLHWCVNWKQIQNITF